MKISIIGLGWFGASLAQDLKKQHEILGTTRTEEKIPTFFLQNIYAEKLTAANMPSDKLMNADVIILNVPPFRGQLDWFKSWNWQPHSHVIFISSTSVYGMNTGEVDELTTPLPETENATLLVAEENWIKSFPHSTVIRFAGLMGPDRHPGRSLSGRKNIQGGNLPVNLVHLEDCIGFTKVVIDQKLINETFNLVSPEHPLRRDYYQGYCFKHGLPQPEFSDSQVDGKIISHKKVSRFYQSKFFE